MKNAMLHWQMKLKTELKWNKDGKHNVKSHCENLAYFKVTEPKINYSQSNMHAQNEEMQCYLKKETWSRNEMKEMCETYVEPEILKNFLISDHRSLNQLTSRPAQWCLCGNWVNSSIFKVPSKTNIYLELEAWAPCFIVSRTHVLVTFYPKHYSNTV